MNKKSFRGSLDATSALAFCLLALCAMRGYAADTRAAWGTAPLATGKPLDDDVLMQVSARGSIDENAVKALQIKGKLAEPSKVDDAAASRNSLDGGRYGAESAEQQAFLTQYKMAANTAQTIGAAGAPVANVGNNTATAPISFTPVMDAPLYGLTMLTNKILNGSR